jgi:tRNA-Thr(GGU) m(6)t(6)A37 methyltransferase TsaA
MDLVAIGTVTSPLTERSAAPRQGHEGGPDAWLEFDPAVREGLDGITVGDELLVLTWLHQAERDILRVVPRSDPRNAERGVFSTRSPARPNPIGLHRVRVLEVDADRLLVSDLEAIDGTPILDVKPVLRRDDAY